MKSTLLSVIVPVFNVEKNLEKCLDSLCKQTYDNIEIILVDDGSTDDSLSVCRNFADKDKRIKVYEQNNKGVSSARNLGLEKANGEYISFVDGDDYLDFDAYERIMTLIEGKDALFFGYKEVFEEQIKHNVPLISGSFDGKEALYQCFVPSGYYSSVCNKVFKRSLVKDIYFDEDIMIGEDELWLVEACRMLKKIYLLNDALYNYVQRAESTMHRQEKIDERWFSALVAKKRILGLLKEDDKNYRLATAKVYNDLFNLKWMAYCSDDIRNYQILCDELEPYREPFFTCKVFGNKRKIKYYLIEMLMVFRFPKSFIRKLGEATTYKIISGIK